MSKISAKNTVKRYSQKHSHLASESAEGAVEALVACFDVLQH
jgi:hypothetical protein